MADEDFPAKIKCQQLSTQYVQNLSFDSEFEVLITEIAGYNVTTDSLKRIAVDQLGRLLISTSGNESVWQYAEITIIADNALSTILTYTVTSSDLMLDNILASGTVDAEYRVLVNGSIKAKYITSEQDRTAKFHFNASQKVEVGDVIDIKVIHFNTAVTGDFNASLIGHK